MRQISRRGVIRAGCVAVASPLLKSIVPQLTALEEESTLPGATLKARSLGRPKYRRVGRSLFEDERGWFRYSIRGEEVFQFAHFYFGWGLRPDKAHLWETIHRYKGATAAAMIEEITASIREFDREGAGVDR